MSFEALDLVMFGELPFELPPSLKENIVPRTCPHMNDKKQCCEGCLFQNAFAVIYIDFPPEPLIGVEIRFPFESVIGIPKDRRYM